MNIERSQCSLKMSQSSFHPEASGWWPTEENLAHTYIYLVWSILCLKKKKITNFENLGEFAFKNDFLASLEKTERHGNTGPLSHTVRVRWS